MKTMLTRSWLHHNLTLSYQDICQSTLDIFTQMLTGYCVTHIFKTLKTPL